MTKNLGVMLTIGVTAAVLLLIGLLNFMPAGASDVAGTQVVEAVMIETTAPLDTAALEAAYAAREALLLAQIGAIDMEYSARQTAYEEQAASYEAHLTAGAEQLGQLQEQEGTLQEQIAALQLAQSERVSAYEDQCGQAYYQYEMNIQQLRVQLDEGNAKLAEALARLGQ
jgi:hypothetical protein